MEAGKQAGKGARQRDGAPVAGDGWPGGAAGRPAGVLVMKARGYIGTPAQCHLGEHVVAFEVSGHCMTGGH
jgi:hypothetical protein